MGHYNLLLGLLQQYQPKYNLRNETKSKQNKRTLFPLFSFLFFFLLGRNKERENKLFLYSFVLTVAMSGTKKNNESFFVSTASAGGCTLYTIYISYISFTAEGGVDINQSPKRSKTRNTPHQTLGTSLAPCLRAISTTHHLSCILFQKGNEK